MEWVSNIRKWEGEALGCEDSSSIIEMLFPKTAISGTNSLDVTCSLKPVEDQPYMAL